MEDEEDILTKMVPMASKRRTIKAAGSQPKHFWQSSIPEKDVHISSIGLNPREMMLQRFGMLWKEEES